MNENINLIEILKDAPKGTKLWSSVCGDVQLGYVNKISDFPIGTFDKELVNYSFTKEGKFNERGECVLFPSKENRDWTEFKASCKYQCFKPFQKVLTVYKDCVYGDIWIADIYSHYTNGYHYTILANGISDDKILPYEGNEDKLGKTVK